MGSRLPFNSLHSLLSISARIPLSISISSTPPLLFSHLHPDIASYRSTGSTIINVLSRTTSQGLFGVIIYSEYHAQELGEYMPIYNAGCKPGPSTCRRCSTGRLPERARAWASSSPAPESLGRTRCGSWIAAATMGVDENETRDHVVHSAEPLGCTPYQAVNPIYKIFMFRVWRKAWRTRRSALPGVKFHHAG